MTKAIIKNKKINVILAIGISVFILTIAVLAVYASTLAFPNIDYHIKKSTRFEVFLNIAIDNERMGAMNVLLADSEDMSSEQKELVYAHIKQLKRIKFDKLHFQETYLQLMNYDFVRIKFDNGTTFYFEPNSNIYSNENTITHKRFYVDTDEFYIWFNHLKDELNKFRKISFDEKLNMYLSVMYPDKIRKIAGVEQNIEHDHSKLSVVKKQEYSDKSSFDAEYGITNQQINRALDMVDCMVKSDILYDFDSTEYICTNDRLIYAGLRSRYYSDTIVDKHNNIHMSVSIQDVFRDDFNFDNDYENTLTNKFPQEHIVPLNPLNNSTEIISIERDSIYLIVTAEARLGKSSRFRRQYGKYKTMKYKIMAQQNGITYIQSAEAV